MIGVKGVDNGERGNGVCKGDREREEHVSSVIRVVAVVVT